MLRDLDAIDPIDRDRKDDRKIARFRRPVVQAEPERASHPVDRPLLSVGIEQDHVVDEETALPRPPPARRFAVKGRRVAGVAAAPLDVLPAAVPERSIATFPRSRRQDLPACRSPLPYAVGKHRLRLASANFRIVRRQSQRDVMLRPRRGAFRQRPDP